MASTGWHNTETKSTSPPHGGYDLELFVNKDKVIEYICQICHHISRQCVEVSCGNGHIFCIDCIRYHFELNGNMCPVDRGNNISITHNDFVRRKIMASKVRCKYYKFECEWSGALRQFDQHISHCSFEPINCKYCKHSVSTQMLREHYLECEEYLVRCSWCKNMYKRRILEDHTATCYLKPVSCPNGCNKQIVSNELKHHLKYECEQRMILCPNYKKYGCKEQIKYENIEKHNTDNHRKHTEYQMKWILAQNERKSQQIMQLQSRVSQLEAPDIVFVDGSYIEEMNGIYKKEKNLNEYNAINDEKKQYDIDADDEYISRPNYTKYGIGIENDTRCTLHFVNKWIFESKAFKCSCSDNALYPTKIKNNTWTIFNSKQTNSIHIDTIKITEIDLFQQIIDKIPSNTLTQIVANSSSTQNGHTQNNDTNTQPQIQEDETKTAVVNPSFVPNDDDKEDPELTNNNRPRLRTISSASNVSESSDECSDSQHLPQEPRRIKVSVSSPPTSINTQSVNNGKWSIGVSIKMKYDQLYDDLLRRESNNGNDNSTHHNPFGPPMVSNETLYRYLTSVGYDSILIKTLWKLIDASNHTSNINNLLTRNGFVAICHLLDKITNLQYNTPSTLPTQLQPQMLNNLISTPVHNERLKNTVFPNVSEFENKVLLGFNDDIFTFTEIKTPKSDTEGLNKQDFLNFNVEEKSKSMDNLLIIESQTGSTPNPSISNGSKNININNSTLEPLAFMNVQIIGDPRSRTKPNTPNENKDADFLSVFPAPHDLVKSKSLDSKKELFSQSKSVNDIFYKTPPSKRSNNRNTNENALNFGMESNPRNDLDDLWDESWHSSMNPKYNKK